MEPKKGKFNKYDFFEFVTCLRNDRRCLLDEFPCVRDSRICVVCNLHSSRITLTSVLIRAGTDTQDMPLKRKLKKRYSQASI
jgi:hypothetical protein